MLWTCVVEVYDMGWFFDRIGTWALVVQPCIGSYEVRLQRDGSKYSMPVTGICKDARYMS